MGQNSLLGSTCSIDLPFQVESEMVMCTPNWDRTIGSINLYVVLKKTAKLQDMYKENCMNVRVTNALGEEQKTQYAGTNNFGTSMSINLYELNNNFPIKSDSEDTETMMHKYGLSKK
jgi:hypothetical protein